MEEREQSRLVFYAFALGFAWVSLGEQSRSIQQVREQPQAGLKKAGRPPDWILEWQSQLVLPEGRVLRLFSG